MARFMADGEAGLPADKGKMTTLEFTFGFVCCCLQPFSPFLVVLVFLCFSRFPRAASQNPHPLARLALVRPLAL